MKNKIKIPHLLNNGIFETKKDNIKNLNLNIFTLIDARLFDNYSVEVFVMKKFK
jgi:hypothetical protein